MTTTSDITRAEAQDALCSVVRFLARAADQAAGQATDAGTGPRQVGLLALSLGAQLVAGQALELLPVSAEVDEPIPVQTDPLQLLRAAEALTRIHPIVAFPPGTSAVIVAICDLIREHHS